MQADKRFDDISLIRQISYFFLSRTYLCFEENNNCHTICLAICLFYIELNKISTIHATNNTRKHEIEGKQVIAITLQNILCHCHIFRVFPEAHPPTLRLVSERSLPLIVFKNSTNIKS